MKNSIEVRPEGANFVVIITENGQVARHEFHFEQHAQSFADGQHFRMRAMEQPNASSVDFVFKPNKRKLDRGHDEVAKYVDPNRGNQDPTVGDLR